MNDVSDQNYRYGAEPGTVPPPPPEAAYTRRARPSQSQNAVTDLLRDLLDQTTTLVRKEFELAQTELTEKAEKAARNSAKVVAGGLVAYTGAVLLFVALGFILGRAFESAGMTQLMSLFVSFLIVGLAIAGVGYFLVRRALHVFTHGELTPKRTIRSVKEDAHWAKEKLT